MNKPAMSNEEAKAHRERLIFLEFAGKSGLNIDPDSIESRRPPEPDIRCLVDGHAAAFELVEICDSEVAKEVARLKKGGGDGRFMALDDPTEAIIREKLRKAYCTDCPIDLLCYTDGLLVTPDDQIVPAIRGVLDVEGCGPYRRVCLLGEKVCLNITP